MVQRTLATATVRHDWKIVLIEFVLVIVGVLIALQVDNWNEASKAKAGTVNTLERLKDEVKSNIRFAQDGIDQIARADDLRLNALNALMACDPAPGSITLLNDAIGSLTSDIVPSFVESSVRELSQRMVYLDLLSPEFRSALNTYDTNLTDEREQLQVNFGLLWEQHVIHNPAVDIVKTGDGIMAVAYFLRAPMEQLCTDPVFRRQFSMTVVWHRSTALRLQRFKERSQRFLETLNSELSTFKET